MYTLKGAIFRRGPTDLSKDFYLRSLPEGPVRDHVEKIIDRIATTINWEISSTFVHGFIEGRLTADRTQDRARSAPALKQFLNPDEADAVLRLSQDLRNLILQLYHICPELAEHDAQQHLATQGCGHMPDQWVSQLRNDLHDVLETFTHTPRVCCVVDRERENTNAIIDRSNRDPLSLQLAGVVTPFNDLDEEIVNIVNRIESMGLFGTLIRCCNEENGMSDFVGSGPFHRDFRFTHCPYDINAIHHPESGEQRRREYCIQLLDEILRTKPDIVFLSNLKLILDPIVPETLKELGIDIINAHPSYLPLNKGYRTERLALNNINPEASGYTFHQVIPELDGGPTLFAQQVPIIPYDHHRSAAMGAQEYEKQREDNMRYKIMIAQSHYTADVLQWVRSCAARRILTDAEAFASEGRPGFEQSTAYRESLLQEHQNWTTENRRPDITFERWSEVIRVPYQRMQFEHEGRWQNLEEILGAPIVAEDFSVGAHRKFTFRILSTRDNWSSAELFENLRSEAAFGNSGMNAYIRGTWNDQGFCTIETFHDDFGAVLERNGIPYEEEIVHVRVTAKRKPPPDEET